MKQIILAMIIGLMLAGVSRAADAGDKILGVWNTTDSKSQVEIFKEKNKFYGKIISLKDPNWPAGDEHAGKPKNDRGNPDPNLRNRPIVGMQFMNDFLYSGNGKWAGGKIYDPESGKTYKCKLTLVDDKHLEVRGFIGVSLLGRTEVWTR